VRPAEGWLYQAIANEANVVVLTIQLGLRIRDVQKQVHDLQADLLSPMTLPQKVLM
jgi:hypothetical protein